MNGSLAVIGLGPGGTLDRTARAEGALARAEILLGYGPYLARIALRPGQTILASDNREELARAGEALTLAADGRRVALVSSGDPGVFAMAAAVMEAIEDGPPAWRMVPLEIVPGVTAMLAAASRLGAPLGHDFCAISLSDNLKPWEVVLARIDAVARAGLAIALYNARANARPWQLGAVFSHLRTILPGSVPVAFVTAALRAEELIVIAKLADADARCADMRTMVIIGTAQSRIVARPGLPSLFYAPRQDRPADSPSQASA